MSNKAKLDWRKRNLAKGLCCNCSRKLKSKLHCEICLEKRKVINKRYRKNKKKKDWREWSARYKTKSYGYTEIQRQLNGAYIEDAI